MNSLAQDQGQAQRAILIVLLAAVLNTSGEPLLSQPASDSCETERLEMVERTIVARGVKDKLVLKAMRKVRRERFVPGSPCQAAHSDSPMSIGSGQTISQPFIVAFMTEAVSLEKTDRCLEIGTGSGYQAAVLAELCAKVWSIEYVPELAKKAEENLRSQGYGPERVVLRQGDGYGGWPEEAPFDVIVVTAAPPKIPPPLKQQLSVGGRLIAPVGEDNQSQELVLVRRVGARDDRASFERKSLLAVRFVPFVGEAQNPVERFR